MKTENSDDKKDDIKKVVKHTCNYAYFTTSNGNYYKCRCGSIKYSPPYSNRN